MLTQQVLMDGSYLLLDTSQKEVIAYSFLHESDSEHVYELGWCGCVDRRYKRVIPQLILQQAKYAICKNVSILTGEFDTTDYYAMEVFKTFPFAASPALITYQKK